MFKNLQYQYRPTRVIYARLFQMFCSILSSMFVSVSYAVVEGMIKTSMYVAAKRQSRNLGPTFYPKGGVSLV